MKDTTGTQLMLDILVAVTALPGSYFARRNVGVARTIRGAVIKFGVPGEADIQGSLDGRAVAIEVKDGSGRLSKDQRTWRDAWTKSRGAYIVGRSVEQVLFDLANLPVILA